MICAFGGNAGWDKYYGGPNDSGTGLFVNNTDQRVALDGLQDTVGSRLTKNLNYHLPTNLDNEQLFTQILLVGGVWHFAGSGIFLSNPDPVNQNAYVIGSPI